MKGLTVSVALSESQPTPVTLLGVSHIDDFVGQIVLKH